jgi:hypothetical protein
MLHPGDFLELPYTQVATGLADRHVDGLACSVGFAFTDARGRRYVSTAGHCAYGVQRGAVALDRERRPVGRLVFSVLKDPNLDFALVQLLPTTELDPSIPGVGTPRRTFMGREKGRRDVRFVGQGLGVSALGVRSGVATDLTSPTVFRFLGAANFQDSGGPVVTTDAQALGIMIRLPATEDVGPDAGTAVSYRLAPLVAAAERALRVKLRFAR